MNHRSAPRLVNLQKMMYLSLNETDYSVNVSDKWDTDDGAVSLLIADDEETEAQVISENIMEKISNGILPNELCILCKQLPQDYSSHIIAELGKHHVRARIENEYQDLVKEPIVQIFLAILRLSVDRKRPQDWEFIMSAILDLWAIDSLVSVEAYFRIQDRLVEEIRILNSMMKDVKSKREFHVVLKYILDFWGLPHIKAMFPTYNQGSYLTDLLTKFQNFMWEELVFTQNNWLLAIENFEGLHSIPIMTIHKSKGLEYEAVYFVGLEDSAFWNFKNQSEEDRCAFFVALSRAKREVMFTFCNYRSATRVHQQAHSEINEFFDLLKSPDIATIIE